MREIGEISRKVKEKIKFSSAGSRRKKGRENAISRPIIHIACSNSSSSSSGSPPWGRGSGLGSALRGGRTVAAGTYTRRRRRRRLGGTRMPHIDELDMRDRFERLGGYGHGQRLKFGASDDFGVHVGHELAVLHVFSPLG